MGTQPGCVDRIPEVKDQTHPGQLGKGSFSGVKTLSSSASHGGSDSEGREVPTAWCVAHGCLERLSGSRARGCRGRAAEGTASPGVCQASRAPPTAPGPNRKAALARSRRGPSHTASWEQLPWVARPGSKRPRGCPRGRGCGVEAARQAPGQAGGPPASRSLLTVVGPREAVSSLGEGLGVKHGNLSPCDTHCGKWLLGAPTPNGHQQ